MNRKEFDAKAEQIDSAAYELAEQIEELAKQSQGQDWPEEVSSCVADLPRLAEEIRVTGHCVAVTFKTNDEM